jgi:hypothetical protein
MPLLTLKFFEEQRRSRAKSMQRFGQDCVMQAMLLDDSIALRETCLWQGRIAMVLSFEGRGGSLLEYEEHSATEKHHSLLSEFSAVGWNRIPGSSNPTFWGTQYITPIGGIASATNN